MVVDDRWTPLTATILSVRYRTARCSATSGRKKGYKRTTEKRLCLVTAVVVVVVAVLDGESDGHRLIEVFVTLKRTSNDRVEGNDKRQRFKGKTGSN